ncbi:hypothetical protein JEQ12_017250 [Ovis aries]|uniref:Uncharacterized protein n=1 Tax=Ovis aries TaxID=9940 RepID=A0A836D0U5_SHEEP|nr:hypothetical protein JEQ12_017250 [Ovis aries]
MEYMGADKCQYCVLIAINVRLNWNDKQAMMTVNDGNTLWYSLLPSKLVRITVGQKVFAIFLKTVMGTLIPLMDSVNLFEHQRMAEVQASYGKEPHFVELPEGNLQNKNKVRFLKVLVASFSTQRRASQQDHPHASFNLAVGKLKNITGSMAVGYTMEYNLHEVMTQSNRFRALHETKRGHKSVFPASKTTILDLTTTAAINVATTTTKLWGPEEVRSSEAWLLSNEAVIRLTLSGAVLKILIVVLIAYLLWKRIKAGESLGMPFHVQEGYR